MSARRRTIEIVVFGIGFAALMFFLPTGARPSSRGPLVAGAAVRNDTSAPDTVDLSAGANTNVDVDAALPVTDVPEPVDAQTPRGATNASTRRRVDAMPMFRDPFPVQPARSQTSASPPPASRPPSSQPQPSSGTPAAPPQPAPQPQPSPQPQPQPSPQPPPDQTSGPGQSTTPGPGSNSGSGTSGSGSGSNSSGSTPGGPANP